VRALHLLDRVLGRDLTARLPPIPVVYSKHPILRGNERASRVTARACPFAGHAYSARKSKRGNRKHDSNAEQTFCGSSTSRCFVGGFGGTAGAHLSIETSSRRGSSRC